MSIWVDVQNQAAGSTEKKEDLAVTIENLTRENNMLREQVNRLESKVWHLERIREELKEKITRSKPINSGWLDYYV